MRGRTRIGPGYHFRTAERRLRVIIKANEEAPAIRAQRRENRAFVASILAANSRVQLSGYGASATFMPGSGLLAGALETFLAPTMSMRLMRSYSLQTLLSQ